MASRYTSDRPPRRGGAPPDGTALASYIRQLPKHQQTIIHAVRRVAREAVPKLSEDLKWGRPTFLLGSRRLAVVYGAGDHVKLGFFDAVALGNRAAAFEGTGRRMRHLKLHTVEDVEPGSLITVFRAAARVRAG